MKDDKGDAGLLRGTPAIADFLDLPTRQVRYLIEKKQIPAFQLGDKWYARKSALLAHFARLERKAVAK